MQFACLMQYIHTTFNQPSPDHGWLVDLFCGGGMAVGETFPQFVYKDSTRYLPHMRV